MWHYFNLMQCDLYSISSHTITGKAKCVLWIRSLWVRRRNRRDTKITPQGEGETLGLVRISWNQNWKLSVNMLDCWLCCWRVVCPLHTIMYPSSWFVSVSFCTGPFRFIHIILFVFWIWTSTTQWAACQSRFRLEMRKEASWLNKDISCLLICSRC